MDQVHLDKVRSDLEDELAVVRGKLDDAEKDAETLAVTKKEGNSKSRRIEEKTVSLKDEIKFYKKHMETIGELLAFTDVLEALIAEGTGPDRGKTLMVNQLVGSVAIYLETCDRIPSRRSNTQPSRGHSDDDGQISGRTEQAVHLGASERSSNKPPHGKKQGTGYRHSDKQRPSSRGN